MTWVMKRGTIGNRETSDQRRLGRQIDCQTDRQTIQRKALPTDQPTSAFIEKLGRI